MLRITANEKREKIISYLQLLEDGKKRSESTTEEIEQKLLDFFMATSRPTKSDNAGDVSDIVFHINANLLGINVDVRTVQQNTLWADGGHRESQLGKTIMTENGGVVLLDMVGPNLHTREFLDTLFHEAVHATGVKLGRWQHGNQPSPNDGYKFSREYLFEEAVAIKGALDLAVLFKIEKAKNIDAFFRRTLDAVKKSGHATNIQVSLDGVYRHARMASEFLAKSPTLSSMFQRSLIEKVNVNLMDWVRY